MKPNPKYGLYNKNKNLLAVFIHLVAGLHFSLWVG